MLSILHICPSSYITTKGRWVKIYLCNGTIRIGYMTPGIKENIQYGTAMTMVASGIIMSFLCFFLNQYNLTEGVLWYMSQALVFCGAVFGFNLYMKSRLGEMESRLKDIVKSMFNETKGENGNKD